MAEQNSERADRLVRAYNRMLERIKATGEKSVAALRDRVDEAKRQASESGELTPEEADEVGDYLKKDLDGAASYLDESGRDLGDWLRFDLQLAETALARLFADVVDQSRVELAQWERQGELWHTGEITGIGTLECDNCGEVLEFRHTARVPPCPRCRSTAFRKQFTGLGG